MIKREDVFKIGRLGKPYGIRGEISFQFDDDIFDRVESEYLILDMDGILVPFFIEEYRFRKSSVAALKFQHIDSQERAAELTGADVYFPRALAEEEDELPTLEMLVDFDIIDAETGKTIVDPLPNPWGSEKKVPFQAAPRKGRSSRTVGQ